MPKVQTTSWLSLTEAAALVGITDRCLRYAIQRNAIIARKTDHGFWLVDKASARAYRDRAAVKNKRVKCQAAAAVRRRRVARRRRRAG